MKLVKPHRKAVTAMELNSTGNILVTGGEDSTIFIFQVKNEIGSYTNLIPIGYINVPDEVTCLTWHKKPVSI